MPAELFLEALHKGTVSMNIFLRRIHNFALDMDGIPKAIIPKRQWPKIEFNPKRAITLEEHLAIFAQENTPEYYAYYELFWHMIFKVLPDVRIAWRDVCLGGFVTAVLFNGGKF
jgi:hypothetical protein